MKASFRKRLEEIETGTTDWFAKLDVVDYDHILDDYSKPEWVEIHHDQTITVLRHADTGEVRGIYNDRRSEDEYPPGADFAYL